MRKMVTCIDAQMLPQKYIGHPFEDRECIFVFSIADDSPSVPGKPKGQYAVEVGIEGKLLLNWALMHSNDDDLTKVLFCYAVEDVRQRIMDADTAGNDSLESGKLFLTVKDHTEVCCPVKISEVPQVRGCKFEVELRNQGGGVNIHNEGNLTIGGDVIGRDKTSATTPQ